MKNPKTVKQAVLCVAIMMALHAVNVSASEEDDNSDDRGNGKSYAQEKSGVAGGAVFGGIVAGPPGFVIGAFAGGIIGRHQGMEEALAQKDEKIRTMQATLEQQQASIAVQAQAPADNALRLASLEQVSVIEARDLQEILQDGFEITIHFRTGSDQVEHHFSQAIHKTAEVVRQIPGVQIHLMGYADPRGTTAQNELLSARRVEAVRNKFVEEGLEPGRIHIHVIGERQSLGLGQDAESLSFDRRVVIQFSKEGFAS